MRAKADPEHRAAGQAAPQRSPVEYGPDFQAHLLEQYKLYVEMADRISARRLTTNQYFLTVNTAIIGAYAIATAVGLKRLEPQWAAFVSLAGLILCYTWRRLVQSHDQLNAGKFAVIHEMEKLLPYPLFEREWSKLGQGKDPKLYRPVSKLEVAVPLVFMALYLGLLTWSVMASVFGGS